MSNTIYDVQCETFKRSPEIRNMSFKIIDEIILIAKIDFND